MASYEPGGATGTLIITEDAFVFGVTAAKVEPAGCVHNEHVVEHIDQHEQARRVVGKVFVEADLFVMECFCRLIADKKGDGPAIDGPEI